MSQKNLLSQLINGLQCLPGVGKKSAQRMAYYLLEKQRSEAIELADVLRNAMQSIGNCQQCRDYTEQNLCSICSNEQRDEQVLCVVESPTDILAIESTASYKGKYFVLMGHLSPLDGIGPEEIGLTQLARLIESSDCKEVIIATSATIEGETTAHYISGLVKKIPERNIVVSKLAQGVPLGGELEFLDSSTLALSLANRSYIDR
ncbi:recombination mediator RecR [Aliikangiella sp. IMCC44653]